MKRVLFLITWMCIGISSFSQWFGTDQTLQSGTYSAGIGANITIADSATVHFTSLQLSSGSLIIRPGATVIVEQIIGSFSGKVVLKSLSSFFVNATVTTTSGFIIGPLSNVVISGDLNFSNGSSVDSGNLVVTGTTTFNRSNSLTFFGCSSLTSQIINNLAGSNPVSGTGYISITSYLFNGSGADHVSNPFTNSNSIAIRYSGTNLTGLSNNGHDLITPSGVVSSTATAGCSVVTPVIFDGFKATKTTGGIDLMWTTKMEQNNKYFVLEASQDGKSFDSIAMIKTYWVNGNSNSEHTYTYVYSTETVKEGSIELWFVVLFFLPMLMFIKKTFKTGNAVMMMILTLYIVGISCSKSNTNLESLKTTSYSIFRVKQVDIDGRVNYNPNNVRIVQ